MTKLSDDSREAGTKISCEDSKYWEYFRPQKQRKVAKQATNTASHEIAAEMETVLIRINKSHSEPDWHYILTDWKRRLQA